jgi:hypothetical protein
MSNNDRDSLEQELANEDIAVAAAEASTERRQKAREEKEREEEEQCALDLRLRRKWCDQLPSAAIWLQ